MAPLCSYHALMAGIWTSKLTKIVNEIWLPETFWGIESFKIFKDVGNEQLWLNTMSQVSISTVYSPPPSTFTLFLYPSSFLNFHLIWCNIWINVVVSLNNVFFFIFLQNCFQSLLLAFFCFKSSPGLNLVKQVSNPSSLQHWVETYIFSNKRYILSFSSEIILTNF